MYQCVNILRLGGSEYKVNECIKHLNDYGSKLEDLLVELESQGEKEDVEDFGIISAPPWEDTVSANLDNPIGPEIIWDSGKYPSIIAVIKLSMIFPEVEFNLDYDQAGGKYKGNVTVTDGQLTEEDIVDYDAQIEDLLLDVGMLELKVGERKQVGMGMVDIECTDLQHTKEGAIKTFNVQFQCDNSPVFEAHFTKEGSLSYLKYSDEDGNGDIEDNSYADEMRADLQ